VVAVEQLTQVGGLEHGHPALLGLLEPQVVRAGDLRLGRDSDGVGHFDATSASAYMLGQVAGRDRIALGQRGHALDHVLQLAHVPGPRIGFEDRDGVVVEAVPPALAVTLEERVDE
jgi:hypothetical protein